MKPTAMKHQLESLKFMKTRKAVFDMSDPGTGKTFVEIMDFAQQNKKDGKAMLVLCPKSLMKAAWANDVRKFAPHLKVSIAWAKDRKAALEASADVIILNHDGVKELLKYDGKKQFWSKFGRIVVDESTAFKHGTSAAVKHSPRSSRTSSGDASCRARLRVTGSATSGIKCTYLITVSDSAAASMASATPAA